MARAQAGDAAAFDRLYRQYRDRVYTLCLQVCGDREEAGDAMQEAFVNAWKGLPKFAGRSSFLTWIYRIAINTCRAQARKPARPVELAVETSGKDYALIEAVRAALVKLKPDYRIILALRYSQELSYTEIAEALGWSVPKVRITLYRAKKDFKAAYTLLEKINI